MGPMVAEWGRAVRDSLISTDPGLNRLRTALKALIGVGSTIGVEYLFSPLSGESSTITMMLGAIVGMLAAMGVNDPTPGGKAVTLLVFPVAISPGLLVGSLAGPHRVPSLVLFVAVMFAAVWVRRFGMRFFMYGMLTWMGYFLADLLGSTVSQYPHLLSIVAVAVAWVLVLNLTLLRDHPDRQLRATGRALMLRARDVAEAATAYLDQPDDRALRRLQRQTARVREAGLMVDAQLGTSGAVPPGWSRGRLRRAVVELEVNIQHVALAVVRIGRLDGTGGQAGSLRSAARRELEALGSPTTPSAGPGGRSDDPARSGSVDLTAPAGSAASSDVLRSEETPAQAQLASLAWAVAQVRDTDRQWTLARVEGDGEDDPFEPAVTLVGGNLPGSAGTVKEMLAATPGPWARLSLTSRQAIQVALATALAIIAGDALSGSRYYWAAIAAFVAFTGTSTTAETLGKAASRVVGTLVGLVVAVLAAEATAGHTSVAIVVILVCVGLGFYLNKVSYALMIFFITVMIAQLYSLLHEFSTGLLVLRLEETAVGAAIGVAVTLLVLPDSTHAATQAASRAFTRSLQGLLEAAGSRLGGERADLIGAGRDLDAKLQQLNLVAGPLTRGLSFGTRDDIRSGLRARQALDFYGRGLLLAVEPRQAPGPAAGGAGVPPAAAEDLARATQVLAGCCPTIDDEDAAVRRQAAGSARDVAADLAAHPAGDLPAARWLLRISEVLIVLLDPGGNGVAGPPGLAVGAPAA
jgi:hypothetical protein